MSKEKAKAAPAKKEAPAPEKKLEGKTVLVKNVTKTWLLQTGSGLRINAGEEKQLFDDNWLKLQINAGFLKQVK